MTLSKSSRRLFAGVLTAFAVSAGNGGAQSASPIPQVYEPHAAPEAVVTIGHARFTVLTPQLIRMEWAADGKFEDHASFAFLNRRLPVPQFQSKVSGRGTHRVLTIDTSTLRLTYDAAEETPKFGAENLAVAFTAGAVSGVWHPGDPDTGNLGGTTRTLDRVQGANVKVEPGLISRAGWALVDDSTRPLFDSPDFSMSGDQSAWPWVLPRPAGDRIDCYFFGYGHDYRKALGDFIRVAGRIPLPPHYAFGNWWSRYWAYSDQELQELVTGYKQHQIPLDVLVIDMDWHLAFTGGGLDQSGHRKGWSGYTWNRNLFPEPERFLRSLHEQGLKVTLNLHPASGVQPFEEIYPAMARAMGQDPAEQKYVPFRITDRKFVDNYFKLLHHPLEKQGVDFWWLDWQQEDHTEVPGVNPTFWLNYLHFTDQEREGKRPLLFHRWGGLGNHRYQIGFSGDVITGWDSLGFQPGFTARAANVGYAYWSHDIGGHIPGKVDPELYTRWIQFGAFSPILRTHTTKNMDAERRVWAYPEPYSDIMADTMRLRYRWMPYIYTEARRTYDTGTAFVRPLYYDWPEQDEAYNSPNEYRFGDNVIAAPVVHPVDAATNLAEESIWVPDGEWIEEPTGLRVKGPTRTQRRFFLQEVPLYERPGSIIPMQAPVLHSSTGSVDQLVVRIAPLDDGQRSSYELYEDSGEDRKYMTGAFARTTLHARRSTNVVTVTIDPAQGSFPGMKSRRRLQIELPHDWPPEHVEVNGKPVAYTEDGGNPGWSFAGNTLTTSIIADEVPTDRSTTIVVTRSAEWTRKSSLLNGFPGTMTSLRHAYDALNGLWMINDLVVAMQTGNRIGYHPDTCLQEVQRLPSVIQAAVEHLSTIEQSEKVVQIPGASAQPADPAAVERNRSRAQRLLHADAALRRAVLQ
jgi:alpha-glucosidase (family GH31 glycosyl hydrolase)